MDDQTLDVMSPRLLRVVSRDWPERHQGRHVWRRITRCQITQVSCARPTITFSSSSVIDVLLSGFENPVITRKIIIVYAILKIMAGVLVKCSTNHVENT